MNIDIKHGPGNAAAHVQMASGETITAEGGSMISKSENVSVETTTHRRGQGSLSQAVKRMLASENFFLNHYTASNSDGEVWLATALPGDMMVHELDNESLVVQAGSFVACSEEVEVNFGWQGFKSFLSGESAFWLELTGSGQVVINAFGAIYPVNIESEHIVDTGHIVAFEENLDFRISKAGKSWLSSFLGGEALVCRFNGRGTVWCQSHNPDNFGKILGPRLKPRS